MTSGPEIKSEVEIDTTINGVRWVGRVAAGTTLLEWLRENHRLLGTKRSCESQVCGACTVLINRAPFSSCCLLAFEVNHAEVTTVEGLLRDGSLSALQEEFVAEGAVQCGYCTSGQLMAASGLLAELADPSEEQVRRWMAGNICRCGCYPAIIDAVRNTSAKTY